MSGERLINKLIEIGVPGAGLLDPTEYDWLFFEDGNSPLKEFLQWFTDNVHRGVVLSSEQLTRYNELASSDEVLCGQQLDDIALSLSTLPLDDQVSDLAKASNDDQTMQQDIDKLKNKLEMLSTRRDQLNVHKLQLKSDLLHIKQRLKDGEVMLQKVQQSALVTSSSYDKVLIQLCHNIEKLATFFKDFDKFGSNATFLSQVDFNEWQEVERLFQSQLECYIDKQFKEAVKDVARQEDLSEYQLLDAGNLDLQLVRGADQEEYQLNVTELNRLSQMMEVTEHKRVKAEVELCRKKSQVEEAEKCMNQVMRLQIPSSLKLLQLNVNELKDTRKLVIQELGQQIDNILHLSSLVSQSETTHTISGNYQVKLQRQEYFLQKQNFVAEQLISQLTRYDWLNIALDLEEALIDDALDITSSINCLINTTNNNYDERMIILTNIRKEHEEKEVLGEPHPSLSTLKQLLQQSQSQDGDKDSAVIVNGLKSLNEAINCVRHQLESFRDPHNTRLHKLNLKTKLLEECLFGDSGGLTNLPSSWLNPTILSSLDQINTDAWRFRQEMLSVIRKHEEKKKILEVEPSLKKESTQWTNKFIK